MLAAIDRDRYEVVPIGMTKDGVYVLERDDPAAFALVPGRLPVVVDNGTRVHWPEKAGSRTLVITRPDDSEPETIDIDIVFPTLHGRWGEDGTMQGMFELVDLPYVGNGVLASAIAMDKHVTKTVLAGAGIDVADWVTVSRPDLDADPELWRRRIQGLGLPAFVKPARAGSSVGVSRVTDWSELDAALDAAFAEDDRVLVEEAVPGREIECGVLGGEAGSRPRVSVAGEIVITGRDFYDFDAKYQDAPGIDLVCPAELHEQELAMLQRTAARAFEALGCEGLARVDFFFTGDRFVVNEVNTMPGFTPISMFPRCWAESGLSYPALIDELVQTSVARHAATVPA